MRQINSVLFISFLLSGCLSGPAFLKQTGAAKLSSTPGEARVTQEASIVNDSDGVLTASLDPNTDAAQLIGASSSSAIAGSSISFPPGSVAIATEITVEEGSNLASDSFASELGTDASALSAASPAMVISSSNETDAKQPFTVALVLGSSLYLDDAVGKELVVLYKIKKASDGGTYVGVIPKEEVALSEGKATFKTSYFGSYQAIYTTVTLTKTEKTTTAPIVTKREEKQQEQATPPATATDVSDLKVNKKGTTFIELGWKPAAVASGYVGRMVVGKSIDLGCRKGDFKEIKGVNTLVGRIDNLAPNTTYTVRICSALEGGNDSIGKVITVTTNPLVTSVVTDEFTLDSSTTTAARVKIRLQPTPAMLSASTAGAVQKFRIKFAPNAAPTDCNGLGSKNFGGLLVESDLLPPQTKMGFRVCSVNNTAAGEVVGTGITGTVTTGNLVGAGVCTGGGSPAAGDTCVISGNVTLASGVIITGEGSVTISPTATLKPAAPSPNPNAVDIDVGGTVTIAGEINAEGLGFLANLGPGHGMLVAPGKYSGASMAGDGGFASGGNPFAQPTAYGRATGPLPGDPADVWFGSGGGAASTSSGGLGGGAIHIRASTINVTGSLYANGDNASYHITAAAGGGSGGTIFLESNMMTLSPGASFYANGGMGYGTGSGGGGSGGRIILKCFSTTNGQCSDATTAALVQASGGTNSGNAGGPAGTIFKTFGDHQWLVVRGSSTEKDNNASTMLDLTEPFLDDVEIGSARAYVVNNHPAARIGTLHLFPDGKIDHSGLGKAGGSGGIDSDNTHPPSDGVGEGKGTKGGANSGGGGGGSFGQGGNGGGTLAGGGGSGYGRNPTDFASFFVPGSGGGGASNSIGNGGRGGNGGGVIRLDADSIIFDANTAISADGAPGRGSDNCGGGGGGGSVLVKVGTLAGPSLFTAKGGNADTCTVIGGGGGGGGRIQVIVAGSGTPNCDASGGTGYAAAGASGYTLCVPPP